MYQRGLKLGEHHKLYIMVGRGEYKVIGNGMMNIRWPASCTSNNMPDSRWPTYRQGNLRDDVTTGDPDQKQAEIEFHT